MALALTRCIATGEYNTDTVKTRGRQLVELHTTSAATDVSYDISNASGIFWTAVVGTDIGASALATIQKIVSIGGILIDVKGDFVQSYLRGAATGANVYTNTITGQLPDIEFNAANGPTSAVIVLEWTLPDNITPVQADYSI